MSDKGNSNKDAKLTEQDKQNKLAQLLELLSTQEDPRQKEKTMNEYKFWRTQPVTSLEASVQEEGPIENKTVDQVSKKPAPLLKEFEWADIDVTDKEQLQQVYELLYGHYVEDIDSTFRLQYPLPMLEWSLKPPGWVKDWYVGVRVKATGKLVGFISAIPSTINVRGKDLKMTEVNFLCVHKKLRSKRLAPLLIMEITRRINLKNIWQALYTSGTKLPTPITTCRYYHRSINWPKLYKIGFAGLPTGATERGQVVKYSLPTELSMPLRPAEAKDAKQIVELLKTYLKKFDMYAVFDEEEVTHWLLSPAMHEKRKVVYCYVAEDSEGTITDMVSFYTLNSTIIDSDNADVDIYTAYSFYYATSNTTDVKARLNDLFYNALIVAKNEKFDVFNALSVQDNPLFLDDLKFGPGDGFLNYYMFNYKVFPIHGGLNKEKQLERAENGGIGALLI